jgi:hypothetical protein
MTPDMPWLAGVLVGLLHYARLRHPEYGDLIDSLLLGLGAKWGLHMLGTLKLNGTNGSAYPPAK